MLTGIDLIAQERHEQANKHPFTASHDDEVNSDGQLEQAALYALTLDYKFYPRGWKAWFKDKLEKKSIIERRVIAGALIAAEIDRIQRAEQTKGGGDE